MTSCCNSFCVVKITVPPISVMNLDTETAFLNPNSMQHVHHSRNFEMGKVNEHSLPFF